MIRPSVPFKQNKGLHTLLRELTNDEEDVAVDTGKNVSDDPQQP